MHGCFSELTPSIKESSIELDVSTIIKAETISVIKMPGTIRIISIVDSEISKMSKASANKIARAIVDISSDDASDLNGISIILTEKKKGFPNFIFNWSFKEKEFVPVIKAPIKAIKKGPATVD